jgi:CheY-like chemotaxis protein
MPTLKVLIVEDNKAGEGLPLEKLLKASGFEVVAIATSVDEAVQMAELHRPALVLMDIRLDGDIEGGVTAAWKIQRSVGAEIVYVTGAELSQSLLEKVSKTAYVGFLTKPFTNEQVLAVANLARARHAGKKVVFVCYAHEDNDMKVKLCRFLEAMSDIGIDPWDDQKISLGANWKEEIAGAVRRSDVAILLISIDFLNSDFIKEVELPALLKARGGAIRVLPVYVRSVPEKALKNTGLAEFQGINRPSDPLDRWDEPRRERDAWTKICNFLVP